MSEIRNGIIWVKLDKDEGSAYIYLCANSLFDECTEALTIQATILVPNMSWTKVDAAVAKLSELNSKVSFNLKNYDKVEVALRQWDARNNYTPGTLKGDSIPNRGC